MKRTAISPPVKKRGPEWQRVFRRATCAYGHLEPPSGAKGSPPKSCQAGIIAPSSWALFWPRRRHDTPRMVVCEYHANQLGLFRAIPSELPRDGKMEALGADD